MCIFAMLKHFIKIVQALIKRDSKDEEIIHEYFDRFFDHVMKYSQHAPLENLQEEAAPAREQSGPPAPKTAKQLTSKRNQERVKSILLLAILDEYLLKFHNCMTRSSTNKLFTPYKDPEREFRSSRRHFEDISLDEDDDRPIHTVFSGLENSREEEAEVVLFYNGLDVPTRQILDSRGVIPSKDVVDAKNAIKNGEYFIKWNIDHRRVVKYC
ncbi:hypothetical protein Tco_1524181 [Tanacetum coccineum]